MDTATLIGSIVGTIIGAAVGYYIGTRKGRPVLGLAPGLVLSLIGWIIMLIIPKKQPG